jgi:hypothetical protein
MSARSLLKLVFISRRPAEYRGPIESTERLCTIITHRASVAPSLWRLTILLLHTPHTPLSLPNPEKAHKHTSNPRLRNHIFSSPQLYPPYNYSTQDSNSPSIPVEPSSISCACRVVKKRVFLRQRPAACQYSEGELLCSKYIFTRSDEVL